MPLTIEFLVCFLAATALAFILTSALIAEHEDVMRSMEARHDISKAKNAARTIESWLNNGRITTLDFTEENITFRIEERLIISHEEELIEVEGVFVNEKSEPV